jgi:hypothetical protein
VLCSVVYAEIEILMLSFNGQCLGHMDCSAPSEPCVGQLSERHDVNFGIRAPPYAVRDLTNLEKTGENDASHIEMQRVAT